MRLTKTKKFFLSALYVVFALSFFLYTLFPADIIREYMVSKLNIPDSEFNISIAQVQPDFPPGLNLKAISIFHQNNLFFDAEMLKITPRFLTLLGAVTTYTVAGKAGGGILAGSIDIAGEEPNREVKFDIHLSAIQIKNNTALKKLLSFDISAIVDGIIAFENKKSLPDVLTAQLLLSDCNVEMLSGILNTKSLKFKNVKTDLTANKKTIKINKCTFQGEQIDGSITGTITLMNPLSKSLLNLNGSIQPHSQFLKDLRESFPANVFPKKRQENKGLPVRLGGTIDKPTIF